MRIACRGTPVNALDNIGYYQLRSHVHFIYNAITILHVRQNIVDVLFVLVDLFFFYRRLDKTHCFLCS